MKRFYKIFASWFLCLFLVLSQFTVSFADVNSLMISTDSNALMTMDLDDSDYTVMPMSSLGTVTNTVDLTKVKVIAYCNRVSDNGYWGEYIINPDKNGRFRVGPVIDEVYIMQLGFDLADALPRAGKYYFSMDFSNDFSIDYNNSNIVTLKTYANTNSDQKFMDVPFQLNSGDIYLPAQTVQLYSLTEFIPYFGIPGTNQKNIAGTLSFNFTRYDGECTWVTAGGPTSSSDYEYEVSDSLFDLSSSVDTMTDEISGVTEAIQNLQGAMEPHYSNVLTQLHHITEQLHAFYDQVYNNIHLPELDMLTQIKTAIENIDLQIEVDISEVKTAINNMSTAVQNKLQTTTDQITNGYDNSGIIQENDKLEQSINDYDEVESEIFDEAGGFVGEFEYPSIDSLSGSVIKALAFVGSLLQSIFLSMGDFSSIITFSLTMIFVMVVVGYHRIRS